LECSPWTTKRAGGSFEPVGEEEMAAVVESADGFVAIITDADGYHKGAVKRRSRGTRPWPYTKS